jgi:flagellar protein FliL
MSEPAAAPKSEKKKSPLVVILVALIALGGGGAGAYFYLQKSGTATAAAPPPPEEPGITALDPFIVNLADPGGHRFLRVSLRLVLASKHSAEELKEDEVGLMRARSSILELLTQQTADHLVTPEGKAELKKAIIERAGHALEHVKVSDVLFTEFVVQF